MTNFELLTIAEYIAVHTPRLSEVMLNPEARRAELRSESDGLALRLAVNPKADMRPFRLADREALLDFCRLPRRALAAPSKFEPATPRHRTIRAKGCLSNTNGARDDLQAHRGRAENLAPA